MENKYNKQMRNGVDFILLALERFEDIYHYEWQVSVDGTHVDIWDKGLDTFHATYIIQMAETMGLSCYISLDTKDGHSYPVITIFFTPIP